MLPTITLDLSWVIFLAFSKKVPSLALACLGRRVYFLLFLPKSIDEKHVKKKEKSIPSDP